MHISGISFEISAPLVAKSRTSPSKQRTWPFFLSSVVIWHSLWAAAVEMKRILVHHGDVTKGIVLDDRIRTLDEFLARIEDIFGLEEKVEKIFSRWTDGSQVEIGDLEFIRYVRFSTQRKNPFLFNITSKTYRLRRCRVKTNTPDVQWIFQP